MDMTVCIATMFNDGGIIGVSDRMISTADSSFEPEGMTKKIFAVAPNINAMNAGDTSIQSEIMEAMQARYNAAKPQTPDVRFTVKLMVDSYLDCYNQAKKKRINDSILARWNLDLDSFLARQNGFSEIFIREIMGQIEQFHLPETETIITGIDTSTGQIEPHIYTIRKSAYYESIDCCDSIGYAAVGVGARHVDSQFMLAKFSRHFPLPKVLFLAYLAKRRSEVALGVGKQTDFFLIGPTLVVNTSLAKIIDYKKLEKLYDKIITAEKEQTEAAFNEIQDYFKDKLPNSPTQPNEFPGEGAQEAFDKRFPDENDKK